MSLKAPLLSLLLLAPALAAAQPEVQEGSGRRLGGSPRARWVRLARAIERVEAAPAIAAAELRPALRALEQEDRRWRTQQSDSDRRTLPRRAIERRALARAAYESGQGRLLQVIRALVEPPAREADRTPAHALLAEARELVARQERASRPEPISAAQPRVFAPRFQAPALPTRTAADEPGGGPPTAEPLSGPAAVPKELRDAAARLDGPAAVYDWVRNQIRPEFYYGRMKGALQAYFDLAGNDADTTAVLVEMMRAKGIPARYVRGTVELTAAALVAVTGTQEPEQAVRVLERAGIPHQVVPGGGGIGSVKVERVWAEAYVPYANYRGVTLDAQGKVWVPLDPGFKPLEAPRGLDAVGELGYEPRRSFDDYLHDEQTQAPLAKVRGDVTALLAEQRPGTPYADVLNRRTHVEQSLGLLPSSLPYAVAARHDVGYDLPDSLEHLVRVRGETANGPLFDLELPLSQLIGRRLTLSYVPATDDDRDVVSRYGSIHNTPPYLFDVRPVLKSNGVAIASGESGIGMAVAYTLRLEVRAPAGTVQVSNRVLAGNLTAIGLFDRGLAAGPAAGGDTAAEILDSLARAYFRKWNESDEELANLLRVAPVRPTVSACLTSSDIEVDHAGGDPQFPITFEWKGVLVDADLRASAPVALSRATPHAERDFLLLSGLEGSVLEDRIFSEGLHVAATSTAAAIGQAASEGIPVHELTGANAESIVPGLPLDPAVKEEVLEATARGLTALLPAVEVTRQAWTGVGYVLFDEETGEAAWQLQGGHSGGVTVPPVIEIPAALVDPLRGQDELPAPPDAPVGQIIKFGSTDFQFGIVNQPLETPLKVLVTDPDGLVLAGGMVTFRVLGGGVLVDPVTGGESPELTVLSDERGEARALLRLGKKTDVIPRFVLFEGDEHSTQVGMHLVSVSSGPISMAEPFMAFALPDDQFDGNQRHATLTNRSSNQFYAPLGSGGLVSIGVADPFGNPLSNIPVRLAYQPLPEHWALPPGYSWLRDTTTTPLHLLTSAAYRACAQVNVSVVWGECPGEAEQLVVRSSVLGVSAHPVFGDSMGSDYRLSAGTEAEPESLAFKFSTWGDACRSPNPAHCSAYRVPITSVVHGERTVTVNTLGNMIEAYPPFGTGDVTFYADALIEKERVVRTQLPNGAVEFTAEPTNEWRREHLTDSRLRLQPVTPGTTVEPSIAPHVGGGRYSSLMTMGGTPQLNWVFAEGRHYPPQLKYVPGHAPRLDPAYVTDGNPPVAARVKDLQNPWVFPQFFSLWGADAQLNGLDPTPVLLSADAVVTRSSAVASTIRPPEFAALLDPRYVIFDVLRLNEDGAEAEVLSASGAEPAGFRVPEGLPVPPGEYSGRLTVFSTTPAGGKIESPRMPVPVCGVVNLDKREIEFALVRDPDNDFTCGTGPAIGFSLCWDAKVTIRVAGQLLTAELDGRPPAPLEEVTLSAGHHVVRLTQDLMGLAADARKPFSVEAVALADAALHDRAEGVLINQIGNRPVTRVGRTFVKGVDLLDGHVVRSATDFTLPGRHLGLEMSRTYSSFGSSGGGAMGAGWSWTYGGGLFVSDCGLVTVVTPSGESQVFRTTDNHVTYAPQKGYHTRLVRNGDLSYDFFDKGGLRHHFREPEDPEDPGPSRRLEYMEEPHGDRLVLEYDGSGSVTRVAEVHPEAGEVRALTVDYEVKAAVRRIKSVKVPGLGIEMRYEHDLFGNLVGALRTGENLEGQEPAAPRSEGYRYTIADPFDRHQMVSCTGPNGEIVEYAYLTAADTFLGEGSDALLQRKQEYAKEVREAPGTGDATITRFEWDYREASSLRYKTTVRDGRGHPTTYVMNGRGSPLEIREPLGRTTRATWASADILKESETDANGRLTAYDYDGRGNLASEVVHTADFGPVETRYEYDPTFNKLTFKRDGEGRESRWEIDPESGDLLSTTDAAGNVTRHVYDDHGRLTSETSPRGHITTFTVHDSFGRARFTHDPLNNVTERTYDARGRRTEQTDSFGREMRTVYDGLDRPLTMRRISGEPGSDDEVTETEYYPGGQVRSTINAEGAITTFALDGLNRVILTTVALEADEQTIVASTRYDPNGNPEFETDRRGVKRRNVFDALNRLRRVEVLSGPDAGPLGEVATFEYDLAGNKTAETGVAGLRTDLEYDGLYRLKRRLLPESGEAGRYFEETLRDRVGNVLTSRDPNGHVTQFTYDPLNRVIRTVNAEGHVATVRYDDPEGSHVNKCEEHDETRGLRRSFLYDELNRETVNTVRLEGAGSDGEVYVTETDYDDPGHAMTVTDARGTLITSRLDGLDRVVEQVVDAAPGGLNLETVTSYDGLGNRKRIRDPRQITTTYRHDGLGRLVRVTDAMGRDTLATYDGEGLKTSETDRREVEKTFHYDNLGRLRRTELVPRPELSGVPWSQETRYLDRDRRRVEIDARGKQTVLDLDGLDRVVKLTDARGKQSFTQWDGVNRRAETDKRGHTTLFEYDRINRLKLTRDPAPFEEQTFESTYTDPANTRTDKDRRGIVTVTQTDPLGRVLSVTRAGIAVAAHTYDALGNRVSSRDGELKETRFEYDRANRLSLRTDGFGTPEEAATRFDYDRSGNPTDELDQRAADLGRAFSLRRSYDDLNRLRTQTDGEGHTTTYEYDFEGNRTSVQEPLGQVTSFKYDELGKLVEVRQPVPREGQAAPVTAYVHDENRNRVRQTDGNQHVVRMDYDELNRLEAMTQDPGGLGLLTRYEYDENGNLRMLHDAKGQRVTSEFDELNRLDTKSFAFAEGDAYRPWRHTTSMEYAYDANGNLEEVKEFVASGADPPGPLQTVREYDDFDRLSAETSPLPDGGARRVGYTYWRNGARKTVTDPSGQVTHYTYDGQNRPETATTSAGVNTYTYWPDDLLKTVGYPNGVVATHGYDLADRLLTITNAREGTVVSSYGYAYDDNGNRLGQVEVNGGVSETTSYTYDGLNRLETVTYPADATFPAGRVVTYGYDAVGNRTAETVREPDGTLLAEKQGVFDNVNRLTALNDQLQPAQSAAFAYDPNGNQTSKTIASTVTRYRYDPRDRLVEVAEAESILGRFQYDFEGRRTKKVGEEGVRQYVYDQTSLLVEFNEAGTLVAKYDYGSDRLLSLTRPDEGRRFFSFDGLRSITNLTDDSGSTVASYHLDAWGNFRFPSELLASKNRFAFTGYIWDQETSLFFAKARFYDPEVGRFTTQDSFLGRVDDPPSLHRYFYANANPARYVDPTGHQTAVATGYEWIYRNPLERLAKKIEQAEQKAKTFLGEVGMGISTGAANALKAVNSPGHMPAERAREYYLQPQTTTERVFAEGTDIALTFAPLAAKGVASRAGARPAQQENAPITGTIAESASSATGESVVGQRQTILQTESGGLFVTGEQGQALYARGRLGSKPAERNPTAQTELAGKQAGDHAGHMLGARFGFEGEGYNLTPMAGSEVNLGSFKRMENFWAKLRKQGHEVDAEVFAVHRSDPLRPDKIVVSYTVDTGKPVTVVLDNPLPPAKTPKASTH